MVFDSQQIQQKLQDFQIKNVRLDESFNLGTRRGKGAAILVPIEGKQLVTACTDERPVKALVNPKTGEVMDLKKYVLVRCAGAAFGLEDAVRNVNVTFEKDHILQALVENEVVVANHIDTHAASGELTGCGYGALRELTESGSVFDRPATSLVERMKAYEGVGAWRVVLDGSHTAEGVVVNPYSKKVLDPNALEAGNAFFSLDLGIYRDILHWVEGALGFGEEALRTMLVKLVRNNLAAVFILSNATIGEVIYIERADDDDRYFAGILHEGLAELKERSGPVMHVLEERITGRQLD